MFTYALLDTGADECALPASYAETLGHNLEAGTKQVIKTGNGISEAYSHTVNIAITGIKPSNVKIDFLPNLSYALIGVKSFLSNFVVTIDYPKKTFTLKKDN